MIHRQSSIVAAQTSHNFSSKFGDIFENSEKLLANFGNSRFDNSGGNRQITITESRTETGSDFGNFDFGNFGNSRLTSNSNQESNQQTTSNNRNLGDVFENSEKIFENFGNSRLGNSRTQTGSDFGNFDFGNFGNSRFTNNGNQESNRHSTVERTQTNSNGNLGNVFGNPRLGGFGQIQRNRFQSSFPNIQVSGRHRSTTRQFQNN